MVKVKKIPQRMCVGCQAVKSKKELVRIVRTPDGELLVDVTGKKAGRGAYICPSEQCLASSIKGKRLERALQLQENIGPEIQEQLRQRIQNDAKV